ncbi:MAG: hypothetical protein Q4E62_05180 [Sutterellaceae bacterium]|nr:hypothetical protein [Sutterellaceae bacterium]
MANFEQPDADNGSLDRGFGLGALVTTGVVSGIAAFSASLLYFHYFPQVQDRPAPIAVVDMVKLGLAVTKVSGQGDTGAFVNAGRAIAMLKEYGYIVLDSRMVIAAPDEYVKNPSDLVPGAPDEVELTGGYVPPNLLEGTPNGTLR